MKLNTKQAKMTQNGKFEHKIDIDENLKILDIQASFLIIIEVLRHYWNSILSDDEIHKNLVDFYNEFSQNCDIFQFPHRFDERATRTILHHLSTKKKIERIIL